jgi:hypothetical protein
MTTEIFCFYLQNILIQTSQKGVQWYSDTSPFSIPWLRAWLTKFLSLHFYLFKVFTWDGPETYVSLCMDGPWADSTKLFTAVRHFLTAAFILILCFRPRLVHITVESLKLSAFRLRFRLLKVLYE